MEIVALKRRYRRQAISKVGREWGEECPKNEQGATVFP